jgi:hypothetical protein
LCLRSRHTAIAIINLRGSSGIKSSTTKKLASAMRRQCKVVSFGAGQQFSALEHGFAQYNAFAEHWYYLFFTNVAARDAGYAQVLISTFWKDRCFLSRVSQPVPLGCLRFLFTNTAISGSKQDRAYSSVALHHDIAASFDWHHPICNGFTSATRLPSHWRKTSRGALRR